MGTLFCFVTCFKIKKFFLIKWDLKTKIYGIVQSDHFSEEVFCLHRHEETTLLKKKCLIQLHFLNMNVSGLEENMTY